MSTRQPDERAVVMQASDLFEAYTIVAVLEEAGIDGYVLETTSRAPHSTQPEPSVPVQVRRSDLEAAQAAIAAHEAGAADLDWDKVDVGQREDELPLRPPGRVPPAARFALTVALIVALLGVIGAVLTVFV